MSASRKIWSLNELADNPSEGREKKENIRDAAVGYTQTSQQDYDPVAQEDTYSGLPYGEPTGYGQRGISSYELARILEQGDTWGFALGTLSNIYIKAKDSDSEQQARFIRSDIQRFVNQYGKNRFRNLPQPLQDFIGECVNSSDVMSTDDYSIDRFMGQRTIEYLIKQADEYLKQRGAGLGRFRGSRDYNDGKEDI